MTFRSEKLRRLVAELPCQRCAGFGRTQAAHRNRGKGMGMKVSDAMLAALCDDCHTEIDQGKDLSRSERLAEMDAAIVETMARLIESGKLVVAP